MNTFAELDQAVTHSINQLPNLNRSEITNYFMDALGIHNGEFDDYTTAELINLLEENGELQLCLDYNNK